MGWFKNQFRKVIQWENVNSDEIVYKYPLEEKQEFMRKSKLVVRPGQCAVFINQGKIADVFHEGTYELKDLKNLPILTSLYNWKFAFETPITADIVFFQTKQFIDNKWGTSKPVMMRDKDFGMIRLRGFGKYSFSVDNPSLTVFEIAGSSDLLCVNDVDKYFRSIITSILSNSIAELQIPALDLAMSYDEITLLAQNKLKEQFDPLGITINGLYIESLSLPTEVEKMMDKRTSVGVMKGSIDDYAKIQATEAMRDAAKNPGNGGLASQGVTLAAGLGMASQMVNQMGQKEETKKQTPTAKKECPECHTLNANNAKFCNNCGHKFESKKFCPQCGKEVSPSSKFCPNCGGKL